MALSVVDDEGVPMRFVLQHIEQSMMSRSKRSAAISLGVGGEPGRTACHGEALLALRQLEAEGMTRSEAIRSALVAAAAQRYDKHVLAEQVAALEADDDDRAEMLAVADIMESLRAPG